ncbi:unnamed protein product [Nesidiocoris tenuis]|uniref:Uncharacterized protein n=1 Tax=Nesidiocoris tenuis TaxID=355587 RepID=A0A6H5G591_9HEMI|nr:unnamed protein product [Nesidiocoris tenuis]
MSFSRRRINSENAECYSDENEFNLLQCGCTGSEVQKGNNSTILRFHHARSKMLTIFEIGQRGLQRLDEKFREGVRIGLARAGNGGAPRTSADSFCLWKGKIQQQKAHTKIHTIPSRVDQTEGPPEPSLSHHSTRSRFNVLRQRFLSQLPTEFDLAPHLRGQCLAGQRIFGIKRLRRIRRDVNSRRPIFNLYFNYRVIRQLKMPNSRGISSRPASDQRTRNGGAVMPFETVQTVRSIGRTKRRRHPHEWAWDTEAASPSTLLSKQNREVRFHPNYSSGTAAIRGDTAFCRGNVYYWEIKMLTCLYGTDVWGAGTRMWSWSYRAGDATVVRMRSSRLLNCCAPCATPSCD